MALFAEIVRQADRQSVETRRGLGPWRCQHSTDDCVDDMVRTERVSNRLVAGLGCVCSLCIQRHPVDSLSKLQASAAVVGSQDGYSGHVGSNTLRVTRLPKVWLQRWRDWLTTVRLM